MSEIWLSYNGKVLGHNNKILDSMTNINSRTLRFRFSNTSYTPRAGTTSRKGYWNAYDAANGIWDWNYNSNDWYQAFYNCLKPSVLGSGNTVSLISAGKMTGTSRVITMKEMFRSCSSLTSVIPFTPSEVTNMSYMFSGCTSLTSMPTIDTSSVTDMSYMFSGCSNLGSVAWLNTGACTTMLYMFELCSNLTTVPLFNTQSVTIMNSMFNRCASLVSVPQFNTASVTSMNAMFTGCSALETVPLFNTSACTNMSDMFSGSGIKTVPLMDTALVTTMKNMFLSCYSLESIPLFNTSSCGNMDYAFSDCYKVESGALALYQQASSQANPPTSHILCFSNCGRDTTTGAAELAQIPSGWK